MFVIRNCKDRYTSKCEHIICMLGVKLCIYLYARLSLVVVQVAMDRTCVDNGCMWFVPCSHREPQLRQHRRVTPDVHVRMCDVSQVYCQ